MLTDAAFVINHKVKDSSFTRVRKLSFINVVLLVLQKGLKSLQNRLNEFFDKFSSIITPATASAFSQARSNLKHTAFIDLNKTAIVDTFYADDVYKKWNNYRILAIDGSKIRLPESEKIKEEFGSVGTSDYKGDPSGEYNAAIASVLYDVKNRIVLDSIIDPWRSSELALAIRHLEHVKTGDLILSDRNYPGYEYIGSVVKRRADCLIRCSRSSFKEARMMFADSSITSMIATIKPHMSKKKIAALGLPERLKVRFVRVILSTGEPEVLVTTILDESFSPNDFKELYHQRWGVETYYHTIKNHLTLENFSGLTVESIKQDFYAMIFMSNLESILTDEAEEILDSRVTQHEQQVNHAVSFNALKNNVIDLLSGEEDLNVVFKKLTMLFMMNPTVKRVDRHVERKTAPKSKLIDFYRRKKKIVY